MQRYRGVLGEPVIGIHGEWHKRREKKKRNDEYEARTRIVVEPRYVLYEYYNVAPRGIMRELRDRITRCCVGARQCRWNFLPVRSLKNRAPLRLFPFDAKDVIIRGSGHNSIISLNEPAQATKHAARNIQENSTSIRSTVDEPCEKNYVQTRLQRSWTKEGCTHPKVEYRENLQTFFQSFEQLYFPRFFLIRPTASFVQRIDEPRCATIPNRIETLDFSYLELRRNDTKHSLARVHRNFSEFPSSPCVIR